MGATVALRLVNQVKPQVERIGTRGGCGTVGEIIDAHFNAAARTSLHSCVGTEGEKEEEVLFHKTIKIFSAQTGCGEATIKAGMRVRKDATWEGNEATCEPN